MRKKAIRINTLKADINTIVKNLEKKGYKLEELPFCEYGFFIEENGKNIAKEIEHLLGYIFIQDASSMLIPIILNPEREDIILDLCAAPGAKTTQIAQIMENNGAIVANDVSEKRLRSLCFNLQKYGIINTIVTMVDGVKFLKKCNIKFNKILLDVPCSASGVREDIKVSKNVIKKLSSLQKLLLLNSFNLLEKDGYVVYSTCSVFKEENEEVINYVIRKINCEAVEIKVKGFDLKESYLKNCYRIEKEYQEKFFVCKLIK